VRSAPFFEPGPLERVSGPSSAGLPKPKIKIIICSTYPFSGANGGRRSKRQHEGNTGKPLGEAAATPLPKPNNKQIPLAKLAATPLPKPNKQIPLAKVRYL
jgi:hypothetical protein